MIQRDLPALWERYIPRFLADGVDYFDLKEIQAETGTWDEWCGAWCRMGSRYEALGEEALSRGAKVSAGELLWRASLYCHYGQYVFWQNPQEKNAAQDRKVELYKRAAPHLVPPAERVEIPFEEAVLPGYLRLPAGRRKAPCIVLIGGLESTKEESYLFENLCLQRGLATFAFDGPGQGEVYFRLPMRPGFERAVSAVLDHLVTRPEIRKTRIGVLGRSLGGYYAPLAAAHERRLRACVAYGAFYDFEEWDSMPPIIKDGFQFVTKTGSWEEARAYLQPFTLKGLAKKVRCPLLVHHGRLDVIIPPGQAERLAREAKKAELVMVEKGIHCCHNVAAVERPRMADWLAANLS